MSQEHQNAHHTPSATERDRRKFTIIIVLASIVIVLFWLATLPFTLRTDGAAAAGPRAFFQRIGEQLSLTGIIFNKTNEVQESLNQPQ